MAQKHALTISRASLTRGQNNFDFFPKPKPKFTEIRVSESQGILFLYICWQFSNFLYICWQKPLFRVWDPDFLVYLLTLNLSTAKRRVYKIALFWQKFQYSSRKLEENLFASMRRYSYDFGKNVCPDLPKNASLLESDFREILHLWSKNDVSGANA